MHIDYASSLEMSGQKTAGFPSKQKLFNMQREKFWGIYCEFCQEQHLPAEYHSLLPKITEQIPSRQSEEMKWYRLDTSLNEPLVYCYEW